MPIVIRGDQRPSSGGLASLERGHRLLEHRLVELEADLADMARLLLAEEIAGAANVEIVARKLEAGAERVERLQHLQPPLGLRGQHLIRREREKRVGAGLGTADAAAQLIELGEAEHIGAVHDQRVGGRDVEARFHDRGREEHVVLAVVERGHDVVELARPHLAVGACDLHLRHGLGEEGGCSPRSLIRGTT